MFGACVCMASWVQMSSDPHPWLVDDREQGQQVAHGLQVF
jgi:hypothetical protein